MGSCFRRVHTRGGGGGRRDLVELAEGVQLLLGLGEGVHAYFD